MSDKEEILAAIGTLQAHVDTRIDELKAQVDKRFDGVDDRFSQLENEIDEMGVKLDALDVKVTDLDGKIEIVTVGATETVRLVMGLRADVEDMRAMMRNMESRLTKEIVDLAARVERLAERVAQLEKKRLS